MKESDIDEQLRTYAKKHETNWQQSIYTFRKHLDNWANRYVWSPWGEMKLSYFPVIFNIHVDGSTAAEISRRSMVVKQNMSRTLKELEEKGMITTHLNEHDKRSEHLMLTPAGKEMVLNAHVELEKLLQRYAELVGEHDLQIASKVIRTINEYHERLDTSNGIGSLSD